MQMKKDAIKDIVLITVYFLSWLYTGSYIHVWVIEWWTDSTYFRGAYIRMLAYVCITYQYSEELSFYSIYVYCSVM